VSVGTEFTGVVKGEPSLTRGPVKLTELLFAFATETIDIASYLVKLYINNLSIIFYLEK